MCLYPKLIKNKKYTPNQKNKGNVPKCNDERVKLVPVGCGNCIECRNQKKRQWQVRLHEEIKADVTGKFVTLTFSEESLNGLCEELKTTECNAIATLAVRRFLERWRKKHKKSVKHWLVTELGHENTERIHLHGIIFTDKKEDIESMWKYGNIWVGEYVNAKTINYIVKYISKIDKDHIGYKSITLCSAGIGKNYINKFDAQQNKYKPNETNENYKLTTGQKTALPIYYRNKIYTEEEREKLWIEKLDKQEIWVMGEKIDISTEDGLKTYYNILNFYQEKNKRLGYGSDEKEWNKKDYNVTIKKLKEQKMIEERKKIAKKL